MNNQNIKMQKIKFYLLKLFFTTFAIIFSAWLLQDGIQIGEPKLLTGLWVAAILLCINVFLKPILIALTIPVSVATFGLFLLVINASMILLIDQLVDKFSVSNFWYALLFSILVSATTSILELIGKIQIIRYKNNSQNKNNQDDNDFSDYEEV